MGSTPTLFRHVLPTTHLDEVAPTLAYEIEVLKRGVDRADPDDAGWCFGLPPGIRPEQWPLDPDNGYPLAHAFTIRLPEDYRCHGPYIIAVSLFAASFDINDGGPTRQRDIVAASAAGAAEPSDPDLRVFWAAGRAHHPRLFRSRDIIDCCYASILLTRGEFEGPLCAPPMVAPNPYRDRIRRPIWLDVGSASAFTHHGFDRDVPDLLGDVPRADLAFNRALRLRPTPGDPNAGKPPCDHFDDDQTGYIHPLYKTASGDFEYHSWSDGLPSSHIGGTMSPCEHVPRLSPFYIEFQEHVGGFNFAYGTGMLDLLDGRCDYRR